jgi:hypothetical protein
VPELLHHQVAQIVGDLIGVPDRGAQQALHPVRAAVSGVFGQPPTVLAFHLGQQPQQQLTDRLAGLRPGEPGRDPGQDIIEHLPPRGRVYAMAGGHRI